MKRILLMAALLAAGLPAAHAQTNQACLAAAHRILFFMLEEAEQVAKSIESKGSHNAAALEIAKTLDDQSCTFLVRAPGNAVRDVAIQALPPKDTDN